MCNQIALAVKRAGLGIPYPTRTPADNYAAYVDCSELLVESLLTGKPLDIVAHQKHATNCQKSSKERRKAKELGQLTDLKRGGQQECRTADGPRMQVRGLAHSHAKLHGRHGAVSQRIPGQHPLTPRPHIPPPPQRL